jgi:hypothetical protein
MSPEQWGQEEKTSSTVLKRHLIMQKLTILLAAYNTITKTLPPPPHPFLCSGCFSPDLAHFRLPLPSPGMTGSFRHTVVCVQHQAGSECGSGVGTSPTRGLSGNGPSWTRRYTVSCTSWSYARRCTGILRRYKAMCNCGGWARVIMFHVIVQTDTEL